MPAAIRICSVKFTFNCSRSRITKRSRYAVAVLTSTSYSSSVHTLSTGRLFPHSRRSPTACQRLHPTDRSIHPHDPDICFLNPFSIPVQEALLTQNFQPIASRQHCNFAAAPGKVNTILTTDYSRSLQQRENRETGQTVPLCSSQAPKNS